MNFFRSVICALAAAVLGAVALTSSATAQKRAAAPAGPKIAGASKLAAVKQIDEVVLKSLIKPAKKPLLINFWATWCDPCREEFPDLVKIYAEFGDKLDLIVISLDDLAEINGDVPKFLAEMNATMPAYLLKTDDENAAIGSVSKDWKGGLPFTILFDENGAVSYFRQGKINVETVRAKISGLTTPPSNAATSPPELK